MQLAEAYISLANITNGEAADELYSEAEKLGEFEADDDDADSE